ncbi:MAG TPA: heavy metal translocating P-type ATPase metal-binding domain-containing protein [Cyclobacteriaceae bacterium]|nr:heavy metal translocating P-type ATPase metal-binding domain-containing protein [Cyclobacteriaceae bacterium]HRJ82858.1 heavy metal translocating P-type ATPase metal-binding domain-containing protein [Cyclobacteriaceae bacterium]
METLIKTDLTCYHCGEPCDDTLWKDDKSFCCYGCQTVYEILSSNDLCEYYDLEKNPGTQLRYVPEETYTFLDEKDIRKKVVAFDSDTFARVQFYIPAIHCVSCIWLLENLQKLEMGILRSEVNFVQKTVTLDFKPQAVALSRLAKLLAALGYAPKINLDSENKTKPSVTYDKSLLLKLSIAGFCFGNVMLFSFPEYLGLDQTDGELMQIFSWLNILLSIPVFLYSDSDYMVSAWKSFKQRQINIDVPIAVGLVALFLRSVWDIATGFGPGYMDSFTGLVFFLLIGRWFQNKTYESLAFDRDFKSYFPLAILRLKKQLDIGHEDWEPVVVYELKKGDQIKVRNMEIVPADSLLLDEKALIDYSFVTGESKPVQVNMGELIYAGGKLIGQPVTLVVEKKTSQSHLTSLWNNDAFQKPEESKYKRLIDRAARRFTWIILGLSIATAVYWYNTDPSQVWLIITSVLIVACPCALALTAPFTYGNMLRVFGRNKLYLKNADVIERMASINAVVFDKTGTVTHGNEPDIEFTGELSNEELGWISTLTGYSTHPLSKLIHKNLLRRSAGKVIDFKELPGKGIEGKLHGKTIRIGSAEFTGFHERLDDASSTVFVAIDGEVRGYFSIHTAVRKNIQNMLGRLGDKCEAMLSGDSKADKVLMSTLFHPTAQLLFNQSPHDKLNYISNLQHAGKKVMMLGDGLNDSGALKQSDVGIAVTDDTGVFTPACDGILQGDQIGILDRFLALAKSATTIVKAGFVLSFMYNAIALSFAVSGHLTPLVAAILMPVSSISVVVFTTVAVNVAAKRKLYVTPAG